MSPLAVFDQQKVDQLYAVDPTFTNVKAYGAKGDGTTDDTTALQAAIVAAGGGGLWFPAGTYLYSSTLVPKSSSTWRGAGAQSRPYGTGTGGTVLKFTGTSTAAIKLTTVNAVRLQDFQVLCTSDTAGVVGIELLDGTEATLATISNVVLKGAGTANSIGLKLWGQTTCICHCLFESLDISNFKEAIRCSGYANANVFQNIVISGVATGLVIDKIGSDTKGGDDNLFSRLEFDGATPIGISISNGAQRNVFQKCVMDGVATTGLTISGTGSNNHNVFIGCVISPNRTDSGTGNIYIGCMVAGSDKHFEIGDVNLYQENSNVWATDDKLHVVGELELDGALNHDGTTFGIYGVTPAVRPAARTITNLTVDRALDCDATSTAELADVLGTLIEDLKLLGILQ